MERLKEAKNIVISVLKEAFRLTALLITFQKIYTKHFYKNDSYFWLFLGACSKFAPNPNSRSLEEAFVFMQHSSKF